MDLRANTAVDVLIGPFVDKTDGNTTEDALTLTQAEIKLSKNGQALAQKADITSAAFDDDGYYNCELDATDTNTEGDLVLIIHQSANALPVRHEFNVLSEAAWDSLYVAKDTGFMDVNVKAVSEDETAANNLELQYDTTGLTGDTFPATQAQVGNIATGAGGLSALISAFAKVGAEPETNTFTATQEGDLVYHIVEDAAGNTDFYYQATVSAGGKATAFEWRGYVQSNGDSTSVWYWDWVSTTYKQIDTLSGSNGTTPSEERFLVPVGATGTGADEGKVRLRFLSTTTTAIATDRLLCEFTQASQSAGYQDGKIWVNTASANTNTVFFVDGVVDRTAGSWANAVTISGLTADPADMTDFHILNGSTIALTGNSDNFSLFGDNWTLQLESRSVNGAYFQGAHVSGIGTSATEVHYEGCDVGTMSVQIGHFDFCAFSGTVTQTLAGDYEYHNCYSNVAGVGAPTFTKTAGQAITAEWRNWMDSITVSGLQSGDTITINGRLGTVTLNGADANVEIRGSYKSIVNNLTGSPTVNIDGAWKGADIAATLVGTWGSAYAGPRGPGVYYDDAAANTNTVEGTDGTWDNPVSTIVAVKTLTDSLNVERVYLKNNSSATLVATMEDYEFVGIGEMSANSINFGSQDVDNTVFHNLLLTGAQGGTGRCQAEGCVLSVITGMEITALWCLLADAGSLTLRNDCAFDSCFSAVAGAGTPTLNINSVANVNVYFRHYSGGMTIDNAVATTVMSYEADGQLIVDATCTSLTVVVRGNCSFTDNGTTTSETLDGAVNRTAIKAECDTAISDAALALASVCTEARLAELDPANLPTDIGAIPTTAMRGTDNAALTSVCTESRLAELDTGNLPTDIAAIPTTAMRGTDSAATAAALTTHDGKLDTVKTVTDALTAAAAVKLALSAGTIVVGTVDTVTNSHTPTITEFQADDITTAAADHFIGRIVIFTSGTLVNQATDITDYELVGGIAQFTVTALTSAPVNNVTFVIV